MAKTKTIIVRVDPDVKARLEAAAGRLGQSLTAFVLEAAEKAAGKVEAMPTTGLKKPRSRGACPTFFAGLCATAAQGGTSNYAAAGRELARHLHDLGPYDMSQDEWEDRMRVLANLVIPIDPSKPHTFAYHLRDDKAVAAWFEENLPRCMELVPRRRYPQFVQGVYEATDNDIIDWPLDDES